MKELELLAAGAVAGIAAEGKPARPSHTHAECLNCGAHLEGRYCHVCGQLADDHHRSIGHLVWEAVEGLTHLDGHLAKTLPALLLRPGALAKDHIEGRRTRHVPPFRLFLIALLVFMFAAEFAIGGGGRAHHSEAKPPKIAGSYQVGDTKVVVTDASRVKAAMATDQSHGRFSDWLKPHLTRAIDNREFYLMLVFQWAHRLAVLMLPILAGLLTLLYVYKRQFYVYDHLVVSMQYLSFCFLVWAVVFVSPDWLNGWIFLPALIWTPFNLYQTLRGAYGSSRIGAGAKALFLWSSTVVVFGALMVGLLVFALNQM